MTSCPHQHVTGVCASCLRERLYLLEDPLASDANNNIRPLAASASTASHVSPKLRRSKSFSVQQDGIPVIFEPQRRSCDVRGRESRISGGPAAVNFGSWEDRGEIEEVGLGLEEGVKMMKNSQVKNPTNGDKASSSSSGVFRNAAAVFGKKLQKWRKKKKVGGGGGEGSVVGKEVRGEKAGNWRPPRSAQSEVADYGYGRRSCDTELPRFSLDVGRMSFDDSRRSVDNPRMSWDGYLIGGRAVYRMPVMGSVVEDCPVVIGRSDNKILVEEEVNSGNEYPEMPGGSMQTRDYYLDSSSSQRRRKSFERSRSIPKVNGVVIDEAMSGSNSKVSPAVTDYLHGNRIEDLKVPNLASKSLRDDRSESFDSIYRDISASRSGSKKSGWWNKSWSIWGLIQGRGSGSKGDGNDYDNERCHRGNGVERSMSETWRSEANGESRGAFDRKAFRSNSTRSLRGFSNKNVFGSVRNGVETNENGLKRNQSARYSSSIVDGQLNPMHRKGSRSGGFGKSGSMNSSSSAKSILPMY